MYWEHGHGAVRARPAPLHSIAGTELHVLEDDRGFSTTAAVDIDRRRPDEVARSFLEDDGFTG